MIFLSAQPDDFYFSWQLELQIFNFNSLGIKADDIHILIGYNKIVGIRNYFEELAEKSKGKASFYFYPDDRESRKYLSSLRPHIIRQHLEAFPYLQQETLFYHDSDIIFRDLPDFRLLNDDDIWYVSDTRHYLDSNYIKSLAGETIFYAMCETVGIAPQQVTDNDQHCGGAQYLLKQSTALFWQKVERDCEALFILLESHNKEQADLAYRHTGAMRSAYIGIQAWCADMWAVFWNTLLQKKNIQIHTELDFCWLTNDIIRWEQTNILHYTGHTDKDDFTVFTKGNYVHYTPFFDRRLQAVSNNNCSYPLVKWIEAYRNELETARTDLKDVTFLITVRVDTASRLENINILLDYLTKYFNTHILIAECDSTRRLDTTTLPACCGYKFYSDTNELLHRTHINNQLIRSADTDIVAIIDTDVIIPVAQIIEAVNAIRKKKADMCYPYDGTFVCVDEIFKNMFGHLLEPTLLVLNSSKFFIATHRSVGGAVFVNRHQYIAAGMENEHFTSWGPEDVERMKRMKNLGYNVKRIPGSIYHLLHERKENSQYATLDLRIQLMEEYFRVCNMSGPELNRYVKSWPWIN